MSSTRMSITSSTMRATPEVLAKADRRQFSAATKLRILQAADGCTEPGQLGALLRREGIYSSHLSKWRWLRRQGQLQALGPNQRGPKPTHVPEHDEIARLQRENARLETKLAHAEAIIDIQKKVSALLGLPPLEQ